MIKSFSIRNFGCIKNLQLDSLAKINLLVGPNSSGKSTLLKALYTGIRSAEMYKRGKDDRIFLSLFEEKLRWVFQVDSLTELVRIGQSEPAEIEIKTAYELMQMRLSPTGKPIASEWTGPKPRETNSVFIPAKEVISIQSIISKARFVDQTFGFDETYSDLCTALNLPTSKGKNYRNFANSRKALKNVTGGLVFYDIKKKKWMFTKDGNALPIELASDGIKKIGILDTLLGNRYLSPKSVVFIDEIESSLYPEAISKLLEIVYSLSQTGIQFFISTHSYFVVKKLYLIAQEHKTSIPILSLDEHFSAGDLREGIPADNRIIAESIRLYEQEIQL